MGAAPALALALTASLARSSALAAPPVDGGAAGDPVATPALRCLGNLASVDEASASHVLAAPHALPALVTILAAAAGGKRRTPEACYERLTLRHLCLICVCALFSFVSRLSLLALRVFTRVRA